MSFVNYNITTNLVPEYVDEPVIVRSLDPYEIVRDLSGQSLDNVQLVQLLSPDVSPDDLEPLANWGRDIPIDIVIDDPAWEFPLLYNFSKLLDRHPIRASIMVKPGFIKAVKLALALNFPVKLVVGQPSPALIGEMTEVLDHYLHSGSVSQPVEYYHSLFLSAYRQEPVNLWIVQEVDPRYFRYVSDDGVEIAIPRFIEVGIGSSVDVPEVSIGNVFSFVAPGCEKCEFISSCRSYFKWPDRDYDCKGVKSIFRTISLAAKELRENLADSAAAYEGTPS